MWRWRVLFCVLYVSSFAISAFGLCQHEHICNSQEIDKICTIQLFGDTNTGIEKCHIKLHPAHSDECKSMHFGETSSNFDLGEVKLRTYNLPKRKECPSLLRAVILITFSNIKWKTMKFRFQTLAQQYPENHCRSITIFDDVKVDEKSIFNYNCYTPLIDSDINVESHYLDFEATYDKVVNTGQYYFTIPSAKMLHESVTEEEWLPFLYIELLSGTMKLHIVPPPPQLNITGYQIKIMMESNKQTHVEDDTIVNLVNDNKTEEVTYDCSLMSNGSYQFLVTPLHSKCVNGVGECQTIKSPKYDNANTLDIWKSIFIGITVIIVILLIVCYVVQKIWYRNYKLANGQQLPPPTKVLVTYSPTHKTHAECVISFVNYLRSKYGIDVMYEGDVSATSHGDPARWAHEAYNTASHVIYVVGPAEDSISDIHGQLLITPNKDVDKLLLNLVNISLGKREKSRKVFKNVFFEYSKGKVPIEMKLASGFYLLKDMNKFIAHLSGNLLQKNHLKRSKEEEILLANLEQAKNIFKDKV